MQVAVLSTGMRQDPQQLEVLLTVLCTIFTHCRFDKYLDAVLRVLKQAMQLSIQSAQAAGEPQL